MPDGEAKPAKAKKKALSVREEKLARAAVKHPNATLAELGVIAEIPGKKTVQSAMAWQGLQKPHVKARIQELLNADPTTSLKGLHRTLKDGLKSKDTKFFAHKGNVVSKRTVVDHGTRHKYLETGLKLHGALEKDAEGGVTNNFFTKEAIEAFVAAFKRAPGPLPNGHDS